MPLPLALLPGLRLPALAAPMFLTSGVDLVVECSRAGVLGSFPALNTRSTEGLGDWLEEIAARRGAGDAAFGVNLIVHRSNPRLQADLAQIVAHRVPLVITSLGAVAEVVSAVQAYGGLAFHDVTSRRHGEKAAAAGVDGLIAVAAGAGGHGGTLSPFALLGELRQVFAGTLVLAGAISTGRDVFAARAMGADMVSIGTRFLATRDAMVTQAQKDMVVQARAADILYTAAISGVGANFLRGSLLANGLDPANLADHGRLDMGTEAKLWKTLWSAGQGVGRIADLPRAYDLCQRLIAEYRAAAAEAARDPFAAT